MKIFRAGATRYIRASGETKLTGQTANATLAFNNNDKYFYLAAYVARPTDDWEIIDHINYRTSSLKAAAQFRQYADETCERVFTRAFNVELDAPLCRLPSFLDPHQVAGVNWILTRKRSYLAHAPGAGKTAEAITAGCLIKDPGQIVLIVPPGLTINWEREIFKFTEGLGIAFPRVGIVGTTMNKRAVAWRSDFLIVPDSMLTKPWVYDALKKLKIKLLAVDEASRFKDSSTGRAKALFGGKTKYRTFGGLFQSAGRTVLLDGSPMPNRPMELWAPVFALDPEAIDCMGQQDFGFRYCGATQNERGQWEFKHSSNEAELKARLRKRFMHVVTEDQLSHPERRRSLLIMNKDVRTPEMKAWEKRNLKLFDKGMSEELSQGEVASMRKELGLRVVPWVVRYILSRLENKNEKILLFAWHREVCTQLHMALSRRASTALVMGGTPNSERERSFDQFQNGRCQIIVGNIAAMGRGHNLQRADRVVFAEPSWSDELNKQCEKRASRRGRDKAAFVRCEYVVVPDSLMSERVINTLFAKQRRVKAVIG